MPSPDQIKSQITSTLPALPQEEVSHFVDVAMQPNNASMTTEQLLDMLVTDPRIAQLLRTMTQQTQQGGVSLGTGTSVSQMGDAVGGDKVDGDKVSGNKVDGDVVEGDKIDLHLDGTINPKQLVEFIRLAASHDTTIERYKQQFAAALDSLAAQKLNFPLTFQLLSTSSGQIEGSTGIPINQLISRVQITPMIILRGSAGSGKSTAMQRTAEALVKPGYDTIVPIYFELRRLQQDALQHVNDAPNDTTDAEQYLEPFLGASIVPLSMTTLKRLGDYAQSLDGGLILLLVDGLNEIYGEEAANSILKRLTTYVAGRNLSACVLVTDRITPRDALTQQWKIAQIERLPLEIVLEQFKARQIDTLYAQLTDNDRTLLQTPYFLVYALEHNTSRLSSASEAIAAFFEDLGFTSAALDRMAQAAFEAYKEHHNATFDVQPFEQMVEPDTYRRLVDEGVVLSLPTDTAAQATPGATTEQAQFDHPLKHDYLAARYLSQHEEKWTPWALDIVSFESNSFDALAMTLEMLPDEALSNTFIERVHNWNWAAALVCIAKAMRTGSGRHSQEIQFAVLALVAEKQFDAVQNIRKRASEVLSLFPQAIAEPYIQIHNLGELYTQVQQQQQDETKYQEREPWFPKWRDLFVRFSGPPFSEQDLKQIVNLQAIIGWTAANVFRRFKLSDLDVRQLRAYYDACWACGERDWQASTIRSRVVLALGATDTAVVVDLLFEALDNDRYLWSRIGAARSVVEIAALTADAQLRRSVIDRLIDMVAKADGETLASKTLREIGQSAFYRGAYAGWQQAVTPLIAQVRDMQQSAPEKEWWANLLTEFTAYCQNPAELSVGNGGSKP